MMYCSLFARHTRPVDSRTFYESKDCMCSSFVRLRLAARSLLSRLIFAGNWNRHGVGGGYGIGNMVLRVLWSCGYLWRGLPLASFAIEDP